MGKEWRRYRREESVDRRSSWEVGWLGESTDEESVLTGPDFIETGRRKVVAEGEGITGLHD